MNDIYNLLCLVSVPGIGSHRIRNLIGHFKSPRAVMEAGVNELCRVDGIDEKTALSIKNNIDRDFADDQLSRSEKYGTDIRTFWDPEYPDILKRIHDPPILFYVKGALNGKEEKTIAVVGTRSSSQYGQWAAERISEELVVQGITVVSGMARGIDTYSHRGAIKGGGNTIAVLGCGVDVVYPPENRKLYERICEVGAVISEFPMSTQPMGAHFPRRNRIISGLSLGTVVVEAGEKSGALITAYMALDQGREVFAVPGNIRSPRSRGTHRLIKEGAKLIEGVEDIISEITILRETVTEKNKRKDVSELLSDQEKIIWEVLSEKPIHIDKIAIETNVTTSEALAHLLSMELKNCIKQLSGMMFVRE